MEETNEQTTEVSAESDATETPESGEFIVERERGRRRPLVPRSLIAGAFGVAAALALGISLVTWYVSGVGINVPDVTGITEGVARARLAQSGLAVSTVERRFDVLPAGTVLAQEPGEGTRLPRGGKVALVVSAGTEEFTMPDVIGLGITVARGQLEQRGLVVRIEAIDSEEPSDTVLETIPAPGATVRTSDIVRVRIASDGTASSALLPYPLEQAVFVIDPQPVSGEDLDPPMEVARRLRSLLEASGARVVLTRSVSEGDVSLAERAQRAAETTSVVTAVIGLDVAREAPSGIGIAVPGEGTVPAAQVEASRDLADELLGILADADTRATLGELGSDPVAAATSAPAIRIRLGAFASREDAAAFRDPSWSDTVARAIYRSVGERFASQ